jgi:hypothetical protein
LKKLKLGKIEFELKTKLEGFLSEESKRCSSSRTFWLTLFGSDFVSKVFQKIGEEIHRDLLSWSQSFYLQKGEQFNFVAVFALLVKNIRLRFFRDT